MAAPHNLICFASDGASVMLGKKSGVASLLAEKYPNIIRWHCLNHRLELAVSSAIKEVTAVNHFQVFFDKLYTLYSRSPKNKHEIDSCAAELGLQLNKIGRIFNVRWVEVLSEQLLLFGRIIQLCANISKMLQLTPKGQHKTVHHFKEC